MGGVIIITSILIPVLLLGRLRNTYLILMIITTVWLGFLGGMDDFIKIFRRNKEGLKGKYKIVGQIGIGLIVGLVLWASPDVKINENLAIEKQGKEIVVKHRTEARKSLKTTIPFVKGHNLDYSRITSFCGKHRVGAGWILFVIMTILVVTAVSNGANLNDGMDGMCAGNSAIIGVALGILAYVSSHINMPHTSTSCIFQVPRNWWCSSVHSSEPSSVSSGIMPILHRCSWATPGRSPLAGSSVWAPSSSQGIIAPYPMRNIFVESLSVIIQVYYYKLGKRHGIKQRIFKRTPIHDNFRTQDSQLDPDCKYFFKKAERGRTRIENNNPLLDYHHHPCGIDYYNIEDKINDEDEKNCNFRSRREWCRSCRAGKERRFDVFVSDMSMIKDKYKKLMDDHQIEWEEAITQKKRFSMLTKSSRVRVSLKEAPMIQKITEKESTSSAK